MAPLLISRSSAGSGKKRVLPLRSVKARSKSAIVVLFKKGLLVKFARTSSLFTVPSRLPLIVNSDKLRTILPLSKL